MWLISGDLSVLRYVIEVLSIANALLRIIESDLLKYFLYFVVRNLVFLQVIDFEQALHLKVLSQLFVVQP